MMNQVVLSQPAKVVFGSGSIFKMVEDLSASGRRRLFVLTAPPLLVPLDGFFKALESAAIKVEVDCSIVREPSIGDFMKVLASAEAFVADAVAGIGGGSTMDTAKLVAALYQSGQKPSEVFGIGRVAGRKLPLFCAPTTAGTGSEVSPNAILLDESDQLKKGVVSPYLMADAAYIDPLLTLTVPPKITAETGMDALSHCVEAYTNKFSHPAVDIYALEGMRLIAANLHKAYVDGADIEAREALSLGSYYGGLCLGPVNTAAVHALSYPLGGVFHISHGLSNAILLPPVMKFNIPANVQKYASVALAIGAEAGVDDNETACNGVARVAKLSAECGIPSKLSQIGVPDSACEGLARAGMEVTRLLKNNPREMRYEDALDIYKTLF